MLCRESYVANGPRWTYKAYYLYEHTHLSKIMTPQGGHAPETDYESSYIHNMQINRGFRNENDSKSNISESTAQCFTTKL